MEGSVVAAKEKKEQKRRLGPFLLGDRNPIGGIQSFNNTHRFLPAVGMTSKEEDREAEWLIT